MLEHSNGAHLCTKYARPMTNSTAASGKAVGKEESVLFELARVQVCKLRCCFLCVVLIFLYTITHTLTRIL